MKKIYNKMIIHPFKKIAGFFLIILGILGGFLPIMPGFVLFIAGLSMISNKFSLAFRNAVRRFKCHGKLIKFIKEITMSFYIIFIRNNFMNLRKRNLKRKL